MKRRSDAKFADNAKLEETVNRLEVRAAIQRDLYRLKEWATVT